MLARLASKVSFGAFCPNCYIRQAGDKEKRTDFDLNQFFFNKLNDHAWCRGLLAECFSLKHTRRLAVSGQTVLY